jgi:hypothetical protein
MPIYAKHQSREGEEWKEDRKVRVRKHEMARGHQRAQGPRRCIRVLRRGDQERRERAQGEFRQTGRCGRTRMRVDQDAIGGYTTQCGLLPRAPPPLPFHKPPRSDATITGTARGCIRCTITPVADCITSPPREGKWPTRNREDEHRGGQLCIASKGSK